MYTQGSTVFLSPSDPVSAIVSNAAAGTTFDFSAGIYHDLSITPKNGDTFIGQGNVVFDGSIPIVDWSQSNGVWSASGFPLDGYSTGTAAAGRDGLAQIPEDLYINGDALLRVGSLSALGAGDFYADDGIVYISQNPTGLTTTASSVTSAFNGQGTTGVTIANITVQEYASSSQQGGINAHGSSGWTLIDVNAIENHGDGLQGGSNLTVIGGNYSNNGEEGIEVWDASNVTINGVTADNNNYAGFAQTWDAGGIKILTSSNVTVTNSQISNNNGDGLWFDTDNVNVNISYNTIEGNQDLGIQYEASFAANIIGNIVAYNAQSGYVTGFWGADILLQDSQSVNVTNNVVIADGGQGIGMMDDTRQAYSLGPYAAINDTVEDNQIFMLQGGSNGAASDGTPSSLIFNGSNVWMDNAYTAPDAQDLWFNWDNTGYWAASAAQMLARPIDQGSTFTYTVNAAAAAVTAMAAFMAKIRPAVTLSVAQDLLLQTANAELNVAPGDKVEIADTAANIQTLTSAQISSLDGTGVSSITTTDVQVELTGRQAVALESAGLAVSDPTVTDTAANIESLTAAQIAQLGATGVTGIISTTGSVVLSVAQALALEQAKFSVEVPASADVTLLDTAANLQGLSVAAIQGLAATGITSIQSENTSVVFSDAQTSALLSAGISVSAPANSTYTENFADGSKSIFAFGASDSLRDVKHVNADQSYDIQYYGVSGTAQGVAYTSYDFAYTAAGVLDLSNYYGANGVAVVSETFTANAGYSIDVGGVLKLQKTVNADHSYDVHYYGVSGTVQGAAYTSYDYAYTAAGVLDLATYYGANGVATASETFAANGGYSIDVGGVLKVQKTVNADLSYDIHYYGVTGTAQGVAYTSYDFAYTAAGVLDLSNYYSANGVSEVSETFTANGGFAIDVGGVLKIQKTVNADLSYDVRYYGVSGKVQGAAYTSYDYAYTAAGALDLATYYGANGVAAATETFTANGG
jgi:hypothetical protein